MPRDGTIRFIGSTPEEMREALASLGCVVVVIGGGAGTLDEIRQFDKTGLPIVPWPATGGTAASEGQRLNEFLEPLPYDVAQPIATALRGSDIALGALAMSELLQRIQRPYADTGPTAR